MKRELIYTTYKTNEGYFITIIDYIDRHHVLFKFNDNPDIQVWGTLQNIKNGQIKNPYHKSVYGIGFYGDGTSTARVNNIKTPQYVKWFSMFSRCYNQDYLAKFPSYKECSVSEEFHNFQNFAKWYNEKIYECNYRLELDKDLLYEGNKIYSPSSCCFIPKEINTLLNSKRKDKREMERLYHKYKNEVPFYIRKSLLEVIKEAA